MYLHNRKLQHFILKEKDQKVNQIDGSLQSSEIKMNGPQRRVISIIHDGERTGQSLRKITGFQQVNQVGVSIFYFPSIYLSFYFFSLFSFLCIFPQIFWEPINSLKKKKHFLTSNMVYINIKHIWYTPNFVFSGTIHIYSHCTHFCPIHSIFWGILMLSCIHRKNLTFLN